MRKSRGWEKTDESEQICWVKVNKANERHANALECEAKPKSNVRASSWKWDESLSKMSVKASMRPRKQVWVRESKQEFTKASVSLWTQARVCKASMSPWKQAQVRKASQKVKWKPESQIVLDCKKQVSRLRLSKHSVNTYPFSSFLHYEPSSGIRALSVSLFWHVEHRLDVPAQQPLVSTTNIAQSDEKFWKRWQCIPLFRLPLGWASAF